MEDWKRAVYDTYRASGYAALNPESPKAARGRAENYKSDFLRLLPQDTRARILDLGCGSGFLLQFLIQQGYTSVVGIDTSSEQVDFARSRGLPVTRADASSYLESNKGFDCVLSIDMIEHLSPAEIVEFLKSVYGALAPRGCIIIRTPNASSFCGTVTRYADFTHECTFTEKSLHQVLHACGFSSVSIYDDTIPFGWRPDRLLRLLGLTLWRCALRAIFALEAGRDRPRLLGRSLIAKARA